VARPRREKGAHVTPGQFDRFVEGLGRPALADVQLQRLRLLLAPVLESNAFYRCRLQHAGLESPLDLGGLNDLRSLPFTTKDDLVADQAEHRPYGTNLTYPQERYTRIHQTSGTTGEPLHCLDTEDSWEWWARCWASVYRAAGVSAHDRVFFAFSFGPFIGFWSAYEGARLIGCLAVPGGGMTSVQRARSIVTHDISVLICTPTYALHLAEVAQDEGLDLPGSGVRVTVHAGEPGASIPATKRRIEAAWGAKTYDHAGSTEVGAWGFECEAQDGLHLNEAEFVCEVIDPHTGLPAAEGELVITNLGRVGMPVIRYRTGDRVVLDEDPCACGRAYRRLRGGVIGRIDQALLIRGVVVFPSALENVIRGFPEVGEFAVDVRRPRELDELAIRVEVRSAEPGAVADALMTAVHNAIGVRPRVEAVPNGSLPRFELKARRFTDHRPSQTP
jgi:phenylacetate-CoA ligase